VVGCGLFADAVISAEPVLFAEGEAGHIGEIQSNIDGMVRFVVVSEEVDYVGVLFVSISVEQVVDIAVATLAVADEEHVVGRDEIVAVVEEHKADG